MPATDTLAALADPTRRRVFEMLAARPSPVGRLADALPVSRPAVSQHLRVLLDAGLVVAEQRGTERVYQVDRSGLAQVRGWLEAMWDRSLDAFEEAAREEHAMRLAHAITTPVTKTRTVPLPPIAAFELFTRRMGEWWPVATHSIAGEEVATLRFEERVGGRLVEVGNDGSEHSWGEVLAWDPPNRFVISWHPTPTPTAASVLEVRFHAAADGGTRLELEHRGWEEFGAEATDLRDRYEPGWDSVLRHFEESASSAPARSP